ncbi:hypothetical protein [Streptomyces sp. NPDC004533]|uniref:hypothetical protein n=1 Tax=Streptomyces sp. NPDC004533 TaxID=3154278 RepID=UPI0033B14FF7
MRANRLGRKSRKSRKSRRSRSASLWRRRRRGEAGRKQVEELFAAVVDRAWREEQLRVERLR